MDSDIFGPVVTMILGVATAAFTLNTIRRTDFACRLTSAARWPEKSFVDSAC
jgi:hypothetical protein